MQAESDGNDSSLQQPAAHFGWSGWLCLLVVALSFSAIGQSQTAPEDALPSSSKAEHFTANSEVTLSAFQLLRLSQSRPEVNIELKRLLAERLRESGLAIQDDSVTDESLFRHISTEAAFRSAATLLLEARGYITTDDLRGIGKDRPESQPRSVDESTTSPALNQSTSNESFDSSAARDIVRRSDRSRLSDAAATATQDEISDGRLPSLGAERGDSLLFQSGRITADNERSTEVRETSRRTQTPGTPERQKPPTTTSPELLREPTPYNLLALRDLYTQISSHQQALNRFGSEMFARHSDRSQGAVLDLPAGPDYILGAGDGLTISVWGGVSQTFTRSVDSGGRITLPEVGPISVAGLPLEKAQALLQRVLAPQFRNAHVDMSLSRLRSIRVYVVGDVQSPGAYDLNALSSPLNALYAAGGPTAIGSLRTLRHLRGASSVEDIDLYDFFLRGIRATTVPLQNGDTIFVPPVGPQITISGDIKRPAIYELKSETSLSQLLDIAGGVQTSAALRHISVERIIANDHRETLAIGSDSITSDSLQHLLATTTIQDGDHVFVGSIVPWSDRVVYLDGHVVRPGRLPFHDGMLLSDVLHSNHDLLPEPAERAEIIRLTPPEMRPETIDFNLSAALTGTSPIALQPFDTIRITGRYQVDAPKVTIRGEVLRPGLYSLSNDMTAGGLVKMAGGFTRSALRSDADLASYEVQDGKSVSSKRTTIPIGEAVSHTHGPSDTPLKPGDVLTVHQISGWNDIGASIKINGEVTYPGTYGLQEGEKLSAILRRAGGFRQTAYPIGAILLRLQVRDLQEKGREELIRQIETTSVAAKLGTNVSGQDETSTLQLLQQQQEQVLQRLRAQQATGRLVIQISADINSWQNTAADIEMRTGDVLIIPKRPGFVLVNGQVYNPSAITFVPHKTAGWYLKNAGGTTGLANTKEIFIVRANGSVVGHSSGGFFGGDVLSTKVDAGDVIVVPQKIIGGSMFWRNMLTTAQLFSSIAIPLAIAGI